MSEFDQYIAALGTVEAATIADAAHRRVYKVLDGVIANEGTSKAAKEGLLEVRENFTAKADARREQLRT